MIEYTIAQYYKPEIYALQVSQFAHYIFTEKKVPPSVALCFHPFEVAETCRIYTLFARNLFHRRWHRKDDCQSNIAWQQHSKVHHLFYSKITT